MATKAA
jgi:hypothetical protein